MNTILRRICFASPLLIFATFLVYTILLATLFSNNINPAVANSITVINSLIVMTVFFLWPISLYVTLREMRKKSIDLYFRVLTILAMLFLLAFLPWIFGEQARHTIESSSFLVQGISIITALGGIAISVIIFLSAKEMVTVENQLSIPSNGTIMTIVQIFYLPIGIWWLNKRVGKIAHNLSVFDDL